MITLIGLTNHFGPPSDHGVEHTEQAKQEGPQRVLFKAKHALHPNDATDRHDRGSRRTHKGPRTWID